MKKILVVCIGSLFLITLSGCSLGDIVDRFSDSEDTQIQDINPGSTRVYMDEIRGTLQYFTGNQLTLLSGSDNYVFDISQATLECSDGMLCGDAVSVIYEGQLDSTDTGAVRVLKVVDDYHDTSEVKEGTTRGQVQNLTANSITIRSKGGKTVTFPITGTEQYYQGGIKAGNWVYLHYKGDFGPASADDPNVLDGSQMKIYSVSDIDPLNVPAPTPTPAPQEGVEIKPENKLRAVNVIYTGDFNGTTLDGLTILGITGDIPENLSERNTGFTISGEITASTANTITLLTSDGVRITCNTESASNESTGGLLTGSSVKVTFNPADSRQTNIYTALKIEDL